MRDLWNYLEDVVRIFVEGTVAGEIAAAPLLEERDGYLGGITLVIRYHDGSILHTFLSADCAGEYVVWADYSFHYQDAEARTRFRFDNAPHHPELPTFPDHMHVGPKSGERLYPFGPPTLRHVVALVEWHIANPGRLWEPGTLA